MNTLCSVFVSLGTMLQTELSPATTTLFWTIVLGFIASVLLFVLYDWRKRREDLAEFARQLGFAYFEKAEGVLASKLTEAYVGGKTLATPHFKNVLTGTRGNCDVVICDRTVGSGEDRTTTTVVAFKFPDEIPSFSLCTENIFWHLADKVGYRDIDFESAPDFSRRFFLHGEIESSVRAFFTPEVIQVFEQLDSQADFSVLAHRKWLSFYCAGRRLRVRDLKLLLQQAENIAAVVGRSGVFIR